MLVEWLAILAIATVVVAGLVGSPAMQRLDNLLYDRVLRWHTPPIDDHILIVAIDDESLRRIGRWPWPRDLHTRMIERLRAGGVRAIGYDVLFVEPSPDDAALGAAMRAGPPTYVPMLFEAPGHDGASVDALPPVADVAHGAAGVGQVNIAADGDGLIRRVALRETAGVATPVPHLMELAYRATTGHASPAFLEPGDPAPVLIPFAGGVGAFPTVSFAAVLAGEVPPGFLRGRTVLVGGTAEGMGDRYPTPLPGGAALPGVEMQANLLNGMLTDRLVDTVPPGWLILVSLVPVWLLMVCFWFLSPTAAFRWSIALLLAVPACSAGVLLVSDWWMPLGAAMVGLLLVYPLWGWRRLQAASAYVDDELARFATEPELAIPARPGRGAGDRIEAQTAQLAMAIDRIRDVRRFASDTVQGLPDPLLITNLDGIVTLANGAATALSPVDPVGQAADRWLADLSDEDIADMPARDLVLRDARHFTVARAPFHDASDHQRGWLVRLADITAIRSAEQAREDILQFLSHDMRSPQASIITLVEQSGTKDDIAVRIIRYARRTLTLADHFVQLARIAATPFDPEPMSIADVLTEAVDEAWVGAKQRGVRVIATGLDNDVPFEGEPVTLRRALTNLIDNAVSFSPPGSIVTCALSATADALVCSIRDQGEGIAPARLATLFDRFASKASASRQSAGLGLAFVKVAVERHGGTVACESMLGEGTTFTLSFPA